jgi:uncharacterized membrane protein
MAMGLLYLLAGVLHFVLAPRYMTIVPAWLPAHRGLVLISGAAEMAGGLGVLVPVSLVRRAAAWGLVALLIAVLPANIKMALHPAAFPGIPEWALWARLPLQLPLIYWACRYTGVKEALR